MNERIKELAEQADEYAEQTVHYYQGQFDGLTWEGKIKQTRDTKFAELIVKECIDKITTYDFTDEQVRAFTRLGIMTAIKAGLEEAKKLDPDNGVKL